MLMNGVAKMPKVGMQPIRRRQLIDATLEAINEVGMHDATIAQIARRAGVSTGSSATISKIKTVCWKQPCATSPVSYAMRY